MHPISYNLVMDKLSYYTFKPFTRLRNKAQIFSCLADDHYHTRLLHSLEVESITQQIIEKLKAKFPSNKIVENINRDIASKIALLHDIGHTPYGHIGERTLNSICIGKIKLDFMPNLKELGIKCGFKHNINSGILYKEYLITTNKIITNQDCYIIDGITKHSKLYFKNQKKCDYGFEYINSGLPIKIKFHTMKPLTIEGFIIHFADEIAQMYSDYLDLFTAGFDISKFNSLAPYCYQKLNLPFDRAKYAVEFMINRFIDTFNKPTFSINQLNNSAFSKSLNDFEIIRKEIIKDNETIHFFDYTKERNIIVLFQHYFLHPSEGLDLLDDYKNRILRYKISKQIKEEISAKSKEEFDSYFTSYVIDKIKSSGKKLKKHYRTVLKVFIMSISIHISKMTDGYADHKAKKIITSKSY